MESKQRGSRWWIWGLSSLFVAVILYLASVGPYIDLQCRFGPTPLLQEIGVVYAPVSRLRDAGILPVWYEKCLFACAVKGTEDQP